MSTENMLDGARSKSGKTQWFITDQGCLRETGGDSFAFTLSREDTQALYLLLKRNEALILADQWLSVAHSDIPVAPSGHPGQEDTYDLTPGKEPVGMQVGQEEESPTDGIETSPT